MNLNGGTVLIQALKSLGTNRVFAIPGESYLAVLDALYDQPEIELISCRQEGGAAMMAEAHGKLTDTAGICFVTRGPGATNASAGVHVAQQDSTPMILFVGQVAKGMMDREAFQEIDYRRFFSPMVKWAAQIDDPSRIAEYISHAYHMAHNGRPGPVVLALPEDMLSGPAPAQTMPSFKPNHTGVSDKTIAQFTALLNGANKPVILTGRAGWTQQASQSLEAFAASNNIALAATFRCQDTINNHLENYIGDVGIGINPKLALRIKQADTLIVIGARLGEMTTGGYALIDIPVPRQKIIHIYPGSEELNQTYNTTLAINCSVTAFCQAIESVELETKANHDQLKADRDNYSAWNSPVVSQCDVQLSQIMHWIDENMPADTIITNGAGNYASWLHRFFKYKKFHTQLAPTSGSMGYGLPAALAAKCQNRNRQVVCFAGDGCLQMTIQEMATAVAFKLNIIIVLINNNCWGTIRMHQEKTYPHRPKGTDLVNPDFISLAQAYGFHAELVTNTDDFPGAIIRSQKANKPALIEIKHPLDVITPNLRLSELGVN